MNPGIQETEKGGAEPEVMNRGRDEGPEKRFPQRFWTSRDLRGKSFKTRESEAEK